MTKDYRVIFTALGKIDRIPDSQDIYEYCCTRLTEKGIFSVNDIHDSSVILAVSCVMPERTVIKPYIPMAASLNVSSETYPITKKIKKIRYISEEIISYAAYKDFFSTIVDKCLADTWDIQNGILMNKYENRKFELQESVESVRVNENGTFITKSVRLLQAGDSRFQFLIKTNIEHITEIFDAGGIMGFGLYNTFKTESISIINMNQTRKGILLSRYCPMNIDNEIDLTNSCFRVDIKDGIQVITEGSVIVPKARFAGSCRICGNRKFRLNGMGFLYYI